MITMTSRISFMWVFVALTICHLGQGEDFKETCISSVEHGKETSDPSYDPTTGFPAATAVEDCRRACRTTEQLEFAAVRRDGPTGEYARCFCMEKRNAQSLLTEGCNYDCGGMPCGGNSSYTVRTACPIYLYGVNCENSCPANCRWPLCGMTNGNCRGGCNPGWYTITCDTECPSNCVDNVCGQDKGVCTEGCDPGWYTDTCSDPCPTNCDNRGCDQATGQCTEGCDPGWYTDNCTMPCPTNCRHKTCHIRNGDCNEGCEDGYHGTFCELTCPEKCSWKSCSQTEGTCVRGCVTGWTGELCDTDFDECARPEDNVCASSDGQLDCQNVVGTYLCCQNGLSDDGDRCAGDVCMVSVWVWAVLAVLIVIIVVMIGVIVWLCKKLSGRNGGTPQEGIGHDRTGQDHENYLHTRGLTPDEARMGHVNDAAVVNVTPPELPMYDRMKAMDNRASSVYDQIAAQDN